MASSWQCKYIEEFHFRNGEFTEDEFYESSWFASSPEDLHHLRTRVQEVVDNLKYFMRTLPINIQTVGEEVIHNNNILCVHLYRPLQRSHSEADSPKEQ